MVRAAAKNHAHVGVRGGPGRLRHRPERDRRHRSAVTRDTPSPRPHGVRHHGCLRRGHRRLARRRRRRGRRLAPRSFEIVAERAEVLRYGENPHQSGARYRLVGATSWWDGATQHGGKEMSYLNVLRRRGGVGSRQPLRPARRRDREARQSLRRGRRRRHHRRLREGQRVRPGQCVRRHRGDQPAGSARPRRGSRARVHRGRRGARLRRRRPRGAHREEETCECSRRRPRRAARSTSAPSTGDCSCRTPTP